MTLAKICGVTTAADAVAIAAQGVEFIGLNFWPGSPRAVSADTAAMLTAAARQAANGVPDSSLRMVGVFVDAARDDMLRLYREGVIEILQLHGDESPAFAESLVDRGAMVWKATTLAGLEQITVSRWHDAGVAALLLDATRAPGEMPGGTGRSIDWAAARDVIAAAPIPIVLAGGLTQANVGQAIAIARPWCVDVASGVERMPGHKDLAKVAAFVQQTRGVAI